MSIVVIYQSKTGFTRKYAEWIGEELDCPIRAVKEAVKEDLSGYDTLIYGGGLMAGRISGLSTFKKNKMPAGKKLMVFATGASPMEATEVIAKIKNDNLSRQEQEEIPFFYLSGGICYEKMDFFSKNILKMLHNALQKKTDRTEEETGMMHAIEKSCDYTDKKNLAELLTCVKRG